MKSFREYITELSTKTLTSYTRHAARDLEAHSYFAGVTADGKKIAGDNPITTRRKLRTRARGIDQAQDRLDRRSQTALRLLRARHTREELEEARPEYHEVGHRSRMKEYQKQPNYRKWVSFSVDAGGVDHNRRGDYRSRKEHSEALHAAGIPHKHEYSPYQGHVGFSVPKRFERKTSRVLFGR